MLSGSIQTRVEQIEQADRGPYTVEVAEGIKLNDSISRKEIQLEICYPREEGRFPLIVISHAAVVSGRDYRPLCAFWASHGYVCISPSHQDALSTIITPGKKVTVFKLASLADVNEKELRSRRSDLEQVLQGLDVLSQGIVGIKNKLDTSRIACFGHQAGAESVELFASSGENNKAADERLKAIISLTGGLSPKRTQRHSLKFEDITVPFMILDIRIKDKSHRMREEMAEALAQSRAPDKLLVGVDLDASVVKKPSFLEMRKALKHSNISLMNFKRPHIFKRGDKKQAQPEPSDEEVNSSVIEHRVSEVEANEMPGENLLALLGLKGQLFESTGRKERINYVMSLTLPFLDAHLKGETDALNRLGKLDAQTFGPFVSTSVRQF